MGNSTEPSTHASVLITTEYGPVEGEVRQGHIAALGIPYASPPTGALRFRAPAPPEPWSEPRAAKTFAVSAPQNPSPFPGMDVADHSEDCLYLNVYSPAADDAKRPVLFWIHGGGFMAGSGAQALYEGAAICTRNDVVLFTINYRLGLFGYLCADDADANAGQLDQIAALRWVASNIAAFGGDPDNVTLFGESAGGMATTTLLAMPAAKGLFHRAISQSGAADHTLSIPRGRKIAQKIFEAAGVATTEELRRLSTDALLKAQSSIEQGKPTTMEEEPGAGPTGSLSFAPVLDPTNLPVAPIEAITAGSAAGIPLIVGSNLDEQKIFTMGRNDDVDDAKLRRQVARFAGDRSDEIIEVYALARAARGDSTEPGEIRDAILSDQTFRIPAIRLAQAQAKNEARTYSYLVRWSSPARRGTLGACHAIDLPFVFGTLDAPTMDKFAGTGPEADRLADAMMDAWAAFARTGDPNVAGAIEWPQYDETDRHTMAFDATLAIESAPLDSERAVWNGAF